MRPTGRLIPASKVFLVGRQPRQVAADGWVAQCQCGWTLTGHIEDGRLVETPGQGSTPDETNRST